MQYYANTVTESVVKVVLQHILIPGMNKMKALKESQIDSKLNEKFRKCLISFFLISQKIVLRVSDGLNTKISMPILLFLTSMFGFNLSFFCRCMLFTD